MNSEIEKELKKIEDEKIVNQLLIDSMKKQLSEDLLNGNMGQELKHCNEYPIIKIKKKKNFKTKLINLFNKIKNVI